MLVGRTLVWTSNYLHCDISNSLWKTIHKLWIIVADINVLTTRVNIVFTKLQRKDITVGQKRGELDNLRREICKLGIEGPHSVEEVAVLDTSTHFVSDKGWSVTRYNIVRYLFDRGIFFGNCFGNWNRKCSLILSVQHVSWPSILLRELTKYRRSRIATTFPENPCHKHMPHELVHIQGAGFGDILLTQMGRLQ